MLIVALPLWRLAVKAFVDVNWPKGIVTDRVASAVPPVRESEIVKDAPVEFVTAFWYISTTLTFAPKNRPLPLPFGVDGVHINVVKGPVQLRTTGPFRFVA